MVMANLTEHGVRMVLPLVLKALDDTTAAWRAKVESVHLLGAMSACAPKQLSTCLPQLVPALLAVLTDPHLKVQEAARSSLNAIGAVVRNPEILAIVPVLMAAMCESSPATMSAALRALVDTSFVHAVDAPSLSLIMPILRRTLKGRATPLKKMAVRIFVVGFRFILSVLVSFYHCTISLIVIIVDFVQAQITGSMCALIGNVKDLLPYAKELLGDFKVLVVDPIPEVRAIAAKALGQLYKGLGGDATFAGLVTWLMDMLKSDTTSVERSGSAQVRSAWTSTRVHRCVSHHPREHVSSGCCGCGGGR